MPELEIRVTEVLAPVQSAAPMVIFRLRIVNTRPQHAVRNVLLQCQLRIDAPRRRYSPAEQQRLVELYGESERWGKTLGSLHWTHVNCVVPAFTEACTVDLQVPCSFDFNVSATKYFYGLEQGEVPVRLLMSGSVFYADPDGQLQVSQIDWSRETRAALPVPVWREMMDRHYPNSAWLRVSRSAFDHLYDYKRNRGCATWEQALEQLLAAETVS